MPFGFERMEEKQPIDETIQRKYVAVDVSNKKDGTLIPIRLYFDGDRFFNIDKVLDVRQGRSLKYATSGQRFRCRIDNHDFYLYFTGERWYVEQKKMPKPDYRE